MLLPALSSAREKARTIKCVSNQKQMGTAMVSYVGDFNDQLPMSWTDLDMSTGGTSTERRNCAGWTGGQDVPIGLGLLAYGGYIGQSNKFPENDGRPALFRCQGYGDGWNCFGNFTDYCYFRDCSRMAWQFNWNNDGHNSFGKLKHKMLVYCMACGSQWQEGRHSKGSTVLISDGSARWVSIKVYLSDGTAGGAINTLNALDNLD